jgi:hypothetical protein
MRKSPPSFQYSVIESVQPDANASRVHPLATMYGGKENQAFSVGCHFNHIGASRKAISRVGVQAVHCYTGRSFSKRPQALQRLLISAVT